MLQELIAKMGDTWVIVGLAGQSCFFLRFLVQWIASEKRQESVIPIAFWYLSLAGAAIVLVYGFRQREPVLILGQSVGLLVYLRNLYLIRKRRRNTVVETTAAE